MADQDTVDVSPETMPLDDLKSLIESGGEPPQSPEPEPEAPVPTEPDSQPEQTDETNGEVEPAVTPDPEDVAKSLRDERLELLAQQHEELRKKYGELQKHSSRLASQLGRSRQHEQVEEEIGDTGVSDVLEERLARLEERQNKEAVRVAIADEFNRFDTKPDIQALKLEPELAKVATRHKDRVLALSEYTDPESARLAAREIALTVLTEAISERVKASTARSTDAAATAPARIAARKTSAALSNTGGKRATTRVQAPNPTTMPLDDLKRLIDSTRPE